MAAHADSKQPGARPLVERVRLGERAAPLYLTAQILAVVGLVAAILLGYFNKDNFRHFYFAYLVSYAFFLTLALGALFFVLIHHTTHAAWSTPVRRIAESLAATLPVLAILSAPILISVWLQHGDLYRWALPRSSASPQVIKDAEEFAWEKPPQQPGGPPLAETTVQSGEAHGPSAQSAAPVVDEAHPPLDAKTLEKYPFLNPVAFTIALFVYFLIWSGYALWFRKRSTLQDVDGDTAHTIKMERRAPFALVLFGLSLTFASFHLLMSLDSHWYSTIFGVYTFAGCAVSMFAALIVITYLLQRSGFLRHSITIEHYHDLGKFLFAFVFFYGYIAFAQYMLLWYANVPDTNEWWMQHGCTTVNHDVTGWSWIITAILFGHVLIPFAGLLSRHVKRNPAVLVFWAIWLLVFHWIDMFWLVMPEYNFHQVTFGIIEIAAFVGIGGVFTAAFVRYTANHALRPLADPRLAEGLALQNI